MEDRWSWSLSLDILRGVWEKIAESALTVHSHRSKLVVSVHRQAPQLLLREHKLPIFDGLRSHRITDLLVGMAITIAYRKTDVRHVASIIILQTVNRGFGIESEVLKHHIPLLSHLIRVPSSTTLTLLFVLRWVRILVEIACIPFPLDAWHNGSFSPSVIDIVPIYAVEETVLHDSCTSSSYVTQPLTWICLTECHDEVLGYSWYVETVSRGMVI